MTARRLRTHSFITKTHRSGGALTHTGHAAAPSRSSTHRRGRCWAQTPPSAPPRAVGFVLHMAPLGGLRVLGGGSAPRAAPALPQQPIGPHLALTLWGGGAGSSVTPVGPGGDGGLRGLWTECWGCLCPIRIRVQGRGARGGAPLG